MIHLWSKFRVPTRSAALAPVIDDVVRAFEGKIDAVRLPGTLLRSAAEKLRPSHPASWGSTDHDLIF